MKLTPVFDAFWHLARERQRIWLARQRGLPAPWTEDKVLQTYKFCNAYRASDRASQYLIRDVIYQVGNNAPLLSTPKEVLFRVMLFNVFKKPETWERISEEVKGDMVSDAMPRIVEAVRRLVTLDVKLFTPAYITTGATSFKREINCTHPQKWRNVLALIEGMLRARAWGPIFDMTSTNGVFTYLRTFPLLGPFIAMQYATDLGYCYEAMWTEEDWVQPGPGCKRGLRRVFADAKAYEALDLLRYMRDIQADHLPEDLRLGGRRLSLMDIQNLFCETDKYARVAPGLNDRTLGLPGQAPKQKFSGIRPSLPRPFYPPKWDINEEVRRQINGN